MFFGFFRDGRQLYEFLNKEHGVNIFSVFFFNIGRYLVTCTCIWTLWYPYIYVNSFISCSLILNLIHTFSLKPVWWTPYTLMPSFSTSVETIQELLNTCTLSEFWSVKIMTGRNTDLMKKLIIKIKHCC